MTVRGPWWRYRAARLATCVAAALLGGAATAAAAGAARVEEPIPLARQTGLVKETYVRIKKPMPASAPAHPPQCDWIGYLRFRNRNGPTSPSRADAILVGMPGILAGASMHDQVARNIVRRAAQRGRNFEYWALDRRSNCLEDHNGVKKAAREHNVRIAFGYYYGNREVWGRRFAGFRDSNDAQFLSDVGLAQTLRDWYAVIRRGVPDRQTRKRKVFCGGHSLGGPLTASFASWDFDGNPATTRDAGYNQCAGFFGFDTTLDSSAEGEGGVGIAAGIAQASGGSPYLNAPPFTPETIQLIGPIGVAGYQQPRRESIIPGLIPHTPNIDLTLKLLYSRDAVNFVTGSPSIRDFRLTNEVLTAGTFDDNSSPVTILRTSVGTFAGGPVVQKDFPTPSDASNFPGGSTPLVNNGFLMVPETPSGPLYGWRNYNRMNAPGAAVQRDDMGRRFTSARSEVADLHQLARVMFEAPADFSEQYFPTRLVSDLESAQSGDRSGDLENLRYDGIPRRPAILIQAGDSDVNSGAEPTADGDSTPPNDNPLSRILTLRGYNHIDVVGAAARQNNGRPEGSSRALSNFVFAVRAQSAGGG